MIDFDIKNIFNKNCDEAFAIEQEISTKFHKVANVPHNDYKNESNNIVEYLGTHDLSEEKRIEGYNIIKEEYDNKFPVGERGGMISGGVHFVLFGDYDYLDDKNKEILYKLLNLPLFCKIRGGTLYTRYLEQYCEFNTGESEIEYDAKRCAISLKQELYSNGEEVNGAPIEFRCNNVFDARIYGYYIGIILSVKNNVKFKKTSDGLREYVRRGDNSNYIDAGQVNGNVSLDDVVGHTIKDDDIKAFEYNTQVILTLLEENGFPKAKVALEEYLKERTYFNI